MIFFSRRGLFIKWPTVFLLENIGRPPEKKNIGSTLVSSRKYLNYTKKTRPLDNNKIIEVKNNNTRN